MVVELVKVGKGAPSPSSLRPSKQHFDNVNIEWMITTNKYFQSLSIICKNTSYIFSCRILNEAYPKRVTGVYVPLFSPFFTIFIPFLLKH